MRPSRSSRLLLSFSLPFQRPFEEAMQWTFPTSFDRPQTWHSSTNRVNYSRVTPWIKKIRHHLAWFTLRSLTHGEQEAFFITYMFTVKNHFHVLFFGHDSCITDFSDNFDTRWIKLEILEKDENEKQIWFASSATFISSDLSIWTLGHHLISLIIFEIIRWIKNSRHQLPFVTILVYWSRCTRVWNVHAF